MDGSFLSDDSVVAASRNFVCIRLVTYESQEEADFMSELYRTRSGALENTTFAMLSPDGKRHLARSGRGPMHSFRGSRDMAAGMQRIAAEYRGATEAALSDNKLPLMKNLEVGLNVAACDSLPIVVIVAENQQERDRLNDQLVPLAWSESLAGQFLFAAATRDELKPLTGVRDQSKILVVSPDAFGLTGKTLAQFSNDVSVDVIRTGLEKVVAEFPRTRKNYNAHIQAGIQLGIEWESEIPETDQQSLRAKARARGTGR